MSRLSREQFELLVELADAYLRGELDAERFARLEAMLLDNPAAAQAMAQYLAQVGMMRDVMAEQSQAQTASAQPELREYLSILHDLEPHDPVEPVDLTEEMLRRRLEGQARGLRSPFGNNAGGELPRPLSLALIGLAAAILLAGLVYLLLPNGPAPVTPSAGLPKPTATPARAVATLATVHQDQWDGNAPHLGDRFVAGQSLTLTHGFAQLTTARGAKVILEAPCTIELIDNDNGLNLIHGKVVGICETASSKGLLVRTAHLDVTDLGTRFGVDASSPDHTQVHVTEGLVKVELPRTPGNAPGRSLYLRQGQAAQADAQTQQLTAVETDPSRFASLVPAILPLRGTGEGVQINQIDPHWQIIAVNGQALPAPWPLTVSDEVGHVGIMENDPAQAQWLSQQVGPLPEPNYSNTYTIQTQLVIPPDTDPASTTLQLVCYFDNGLAAVRINDRPVDDTVGSLNHGEAWQFSATLAQLAMKPGTNLVQFELANFRGTPMGLNVHWELAVAGPLAAEQGGETP